MYDRSAMVHVMSGWIGAHTGDKMHKTILSIYNSNKKLPRGYKMKTTDAWCAATVSAAAISLGYEAIIPPECSCGKMIELFKALGCWEERDDFVPSPGDIIFYDWSDNGIGDDTKGHDHVGVVEQVASGRITVIEGNYGGEVKRRVIKVNGRYIRGYGLPMYDKTSCDPIYYVAVKGDTVSKIAPKFYMTKDEFIKLNNLKAPYWLYAGKKYRVSR